MDNRFILIRQQYKGHVFANSFAAIGTQLALGDAHRLAASLGPLIFDGQGLGAKQGAFETVFAQNALIGLQDVVEKGLQSFDSNRVGKQLQRLGWGTCPPPLEITLIRPRIFCVKIRTNADVGVATLERFARFL